MEDMNVSGHGEGAAGLPPHYPAHLLATSDLIEWWCVSGHHLRMAAQLPDRLTIRERAWAYCAGDAPESAHEWRSRGDLTLADRRSLGLRS